MVDEKIIKKDFECEIFHDAQMESKLFERKYNDKVNDHSEFEEICDSKNEEEFICLDKLSFFKTGCCNRYFDSNNYFIS